jgi:hypothetical protein
VSPRALRALHASKITREPLLIIFAADLALDDPRSTLGEPPSQNPSRGCALSRACSIGEDDAPWPSIAVWAHTASAAPGWPASRLGRIWPRSSEARPDPAFSYFFSPVINLCG